MSAKRPNTSSPKRKPSSPKPKAVSRNSKPKPRKVSGQTPKPHRGRWWLITGAVIVILGIVTWFGTANLRTQRAIEFDAQSQAALQRNDLDAAYQQERFAYALAPRPERALTLGSLAYLRKDYAAAQRHFQVGGRGDDSARVRALIGLTASAAEAGDDRAFDRAVETIGQPPTEGLRLALANAAIDQGNLSLAANTLVNDKPDNQNVAFAKAIGQAGEDVAAARRTVAAADRGFVQPEFPDPAYEKFIENLIAVPKNGLPELRTTLEAMSGDLADVSRTVTLAEALYGFGDYRAAERLARDAAQAKPDYREAWNVLAAAQLSQRQFSDAERSLKISADLDASYGYTWYLRSKLAEATGKTKQAAEFRKRAELLGYEKP